MAAPAGARRGRDDDRGGRHGRGDLPLDRIGLQLFTVRDLLADNELDLPGTFEMLADAGYAEVEIGGTYDGRTAAAFRELANGYGLKPEGSHVPGGGAAWRGNRAQIFADAAALGLRYVGIASPPENTPRTHDGYRAMAEEFNAWGAEARAHGLRFYFHNHPEDFTLDGGTPIYDTLLEETDRRLVWFELDIAWIEAGGQSAFQYVREDPYRYPLFHVKDIRWDPAGPRITPATVAQPNRRFWLSTSVRATSTSPGSSRPCATSTTTTTSWSTTTRPTTRRPPAPHRGRATRRARRTRPGRAASTWRSSRCGAVASGRGGPGRRRRSW